jgi:hypothetical protein
LKASEALSLRAEAEEKIRNQRSVEIAKNAILEGFDNAMISKLTGLTIEQIEALRNEKS